MPYVALFLVNEAVEHLLLWLPTVRVESEVGLPVEDAHAFDFADDVTIVDRCSGAGSGYHC